MKEFKLNQDKPKPIAELSGSSKEKSPNVGHFISILIL